MEIYFITTSYSSQIYFIITSYMKYRWLWCRILDTALHVTHTDSAITQAVSNIERSNQEDSTGEIYLPSAKLLHKPNNNFTHKKILNS